MFADVAPFDNNDVRLALKYGIDRNAILQEASCAVTDTSATIIRLARANATSQATYRCASTTPTGRDIT